MTVVNKFNVNKQQVTLDADIIENMSANDVSYDASTQYDENTVGDKLLELENEVIYDVTANNNGATFASLSELLSSENLSTLIPVAVRCGGMSIRFAQSSDNKYVQFRYMSNDAATAATFTNANNWQGVSVGITAFGEDLARSVDVYKNLYNLSDFVINTFAGVCCDNFGTGHISKASSTLGWDSIIIPIESKNYLYTIENAPLIDGPHASKVVLYSGYPSDSDATSKYVGIRTMSLPSKQGQPATLVIESTYASAKYLLIPVVYGSSIDNIRIYVSNPREEKDKIKAWVLGESYTVNNVKRNPDGDVLSFDLTYPDSKTGSASITRNSDEGVISAVYTYNGVYTITITVSRNSDGDLISSSIAII